MKVIGLTGPSGAGKSSCCAALESFGIPTINTDLVYHELIAADSPCTKELAAAFGDSIFNQQRGVDRKVLAAIVFSDPQKIAQLNKITHKYVHKETVARIEQYRSQNRFAVTVDVPLLFEANFDRFCDLCISVLAPRDLRLVRIMARDRITREQAEARLSAQKPDDYYTARSSYVIINDSDENNMRRQIESILRMESILA